MRRHVVAGLLVLGIAGLTLTGCDSSKTHCSSSSCDIEVKGNVKVDRPAQVPDRSRNFLRSHHSSHHFSHHSHHNDHYRNNHHNMNNSDIWFRVRGYSANAVRISLKGATRTVRQGGTTMLGGMAFTATSVGGHSAKLHVRW